MALPADHMHAQAKRDEQMLKRRNVYFGPKTPSSNELVVRIFIAVTHTKNKCNALYI